jgi:(heptosyl)LPS beta-1,4-glucosyltransferase
LRSNVTVFLEVFNEEDRIESVCEFFQWADELIIVDKSSTDKTLDIAKRYTKKIHIVPYTDTSSTYGIDVCNKHQTDSEWYLFITASSAIEPELVKELVKLTTDSNFDYDIISLPLKMHVLGISSKRSPWDGTYKNTCIRKSALKLSTKVHHETGSESDKIYKGLLETGSYLHHFTHRQIDIFFERHIRYTREEARANAENKEINLSLEFRQIIKALLSVIFKRK